MKLLKKFFMLGIALSTPLVQAQLNAPEVPQTPADSQEGRELQEADPSEFPEDEYYVPEEMTPEEQEEKKLYPDEQEWELGEPLPEDEQEFSPTEEYDSF